MGGDHEYGRGNAPRGGSRSYGGGRRGYGAGSEDANGSGGDTPSGNGEQPGYQAGAPYSQSGGAEPRGYGDPGYGDRGYGASGGAANAGGGAARGYGQDDGGSGRGYGEPRGYGQPASDPYTGGRRAKQGPIPGEVVYGSNTGSAATPDGTRQMPGFPDEPTRVGDEAVGAAPRRSRVEERRAARNGTDAPTEYAPGQERSTRYGPSAIDGRPTRNGAGRNAGRAGARPAKKTGYHRYFDYPRTGLDGWRHWTPSVKQVCSLMLAGFFMVIGLIAFEYATVQIPTAESLAAQAQVTNFTYDDGSTAFAKLNNATNRRDVNIGDVPVTMQNAIIAAEDKTFRTNPGISYTGMIRSFINDVEGKPLQGGSTLTQQFVKNAYLTQSQTFSRKVDEIFIALKIGHTWTKDRVMQEYLNTVFFGRNAYGVEAASKAWLGKDVTQITDPSDAAFLASLVNQPTNFSKGWDSTEDQATQQYWQGQLKTRWSAVLKNMLAYGLIKQADYDAAIAKFPAVVSQSDTSETVEQQQMKEAVANWIDSYAAANPNSGLPDMNHIESSNGGYTIVTTFNQHYMDLAKKAVQDQLLSKLNSKDWYDQNLYPALAAVDPSTGELIAFYGGTGQYNWATQGQVQPGSTFKAFTLATAFKQNISPDSYLDGDSPWPDKNNTTEMAAAAGDPPVRNDDGSHGTITITKATAESVNTAFVRLANQVTYKDVMQTVNDLGINDKNAQGLDANARLTLGIAAVSPARMASAYATFANNGNQYPLIEVKEIKNVSTGFDWKPDVKPKQVLDPNVAETVTQTLTHVTQDSDGTAYGASDPNHSGLQNIAGKTGTSTMDMGTLQQNYPDIYSKTENGTFTTAAAWFNGYTSKLETAVAVSRWVNEKDPKTGKTVQVQAPVDNINGAGFTYGASVSLPIWSEFMKLMQGTNSKYVGDPPFPAPNTANMTISNSPAPSAAPSASASSSPSNHGGASASATPSYSASPSSSATCQQGFLGGLTGGCGGGGGGGGPTLTPTATPSSTPSPKKSR